MLNHTYLSKVTPSEEDCDEDDESIRDDLFTPSAHAKNSTRIIQVVKFG